MIPLNYIFNNVLLIFHHFFKTLKKVNMSKFGFSFSLSRLLGIAQAKQKFARTTGIPTTKGGLQRKIGASILKMFFK